MTWGYVSSNLYINTWLRKIRDLINSNCTWYSCHMAWNCYQINFVAADISEIYRPFFFMILKINRTAWLSFVVRFQSNIYRSSKDQGWYMCNGILLHIYDYYPIRDHRSSGPKWKYWCSIRTKWQPINQYLYILIKGLEKRWMMMVMMMELKSDACLAG